MKNSKQSLLSYELELFKSLYEAENDHRHKHSDKAFKSITIIASFVGAVLWLIFRFLKICYDECCCLRCINFILLTACGILMLTCIVIFFKGLYGYNEKRPDPTEVEKLITEYKSQTENDNDIIAAINESMVMSYRDAAINNRIENEKHTILFGLFYKVIFIEMFLLIVTFFVEILI